METFDKITLHHGDCMEILRSLPDSAFDLAIVDPPYGINATVCGNGSRQRKYDRSKANLWDSQPPNDDFFEQLRRVARYYVVWGGNYFKALSPMSNFLVWDKKQPDGVSFAQAEIAATNLPGKSRIFRRSAIGQKDRIHPTQKPVELYGWILNTFAQNGWKILDTHLGSGSSAIAAYELGFEFVGIEIDDAYYSATKQRFISHIREPRLL